MNRDGGLALQYASMAMRRDREVVLAAEREREREREREASVRALRCINGLCQRADTKLI